RHRKRAAADRDALNGEGECVRGPDARRVLLFVEERDLRLAERRPAGLFAARVDCRLGLPRVPPDDELRVASEAAARDQARLIEARQRGAIVARIEADEPAIEGV